LWLLCACLGVLLASPARAEGVKVAAASPAQKRDAEKKFAEGKKLFEKGKFDQAVERFRASHDSVADAKASLMLATALRNTGDLLTARAEYQRARAEAEDAVRTDEKYRSTLTKVRESMDELDGVLGRLSIQLVHAPAGTEVMVDGDRVPLAKLAEPVFVAPGSVTVEATAPDGTVARRVASVNAGQSATVELPFPHHEAPAELPDKEPAAPREEAQAPPPSGGRKDHTLAFVAGGVGIAGIATFAVFGVLANSKFDQLESDCPGGHCTPDHDSDIAAGKRFQTVANVGLGIGIAGVVTSAALFVFGGGSDPEAPKSASARVGIGFGSVELRGSFQ
jgi:hypothetical protein